MDLARVCNLCRNLDGMRIPHSFAFQPIVSARQEKIFGHESLVRGPGGEPAVTVLSQVNDENRYAFDQMCRVGAIARAAELRLPGHLFINFYPNAVYKAETCIRRTLEACEETGLQVQRLVFEVSESELVNNEHHLLEIFRAYKGMGFKTAIDDFGSGYAGLNFLSEFQPDFLKLDMQLIRGIHESHVKQTIVAGVLSMCGPLNIAPLAEGVETMQEYLYLEGQGVDLMQGYYFCRPQAQPTELDWTLLRQRKTAGS